MGSDRGDGSASHGDYWLVFVVELQETEEAEQECLSKSLADYVIGNGRATCKPQLQMSSTQNFMSFG